MSNTMFSKDSLDKAMQENKEEMKKINQIPIPYGFNVLELSSIELVKTKTEKPMFKIGVRKSDDKEEKYREAIENVVIDESGKTTKGGVNLNLYSMLVFLANSFGLVVTELEENDPLGDLDKKAKTCIGKKFRGVISHEKKLNRDQQGGVIGNKVITNVGIELRRCRSINDTSLKEDVIKASDFMTELTPRERAIYEGKILPDEVKKPASHSGTDDAFGQPEITDKPGEGLNKLPF